MVRKIIDVLILVMSTHEKIDGCVHSFRPEHCVMCKFQRTTSEYKQCAKIAVQTNYNVWRVRMRTSEFKALVMFSESFVARHLYSTRCNTPAFSRILEVGFCFPLIPWGYSLLRIFISILEIAQLVSYPSHSGIDFSILLFFLILLFKNRKFPIPWDYSFLTFFIFF